jgi:long-subunit fatty acid transport protein
VRRWLEMNSSKPTLAYPVTDSLSLGLGYRFLRSEDLVFKVAKTGSLDSNYQSHNVLFQAHWDFEPARSGRSTDGRPEHG